MDFLSDRLRKSTYGEKSSKETNYSGKRSTERGEVKATITDKMDLLPYTEGEVYLLTNGHFIIVNSAENGFIEYFDTIAESNVNKHGIYSLVLVDKFLDLNVVFDVSKSHRVAFSEVNGKIARYLGRLTATKKQQLASLRADYVKSL